MKKTVMRASAVFVVLLLATPAVAQRTATVLLRSGERVSGEFEDIQFDLLYLRVSHEEERRIPVGDVALVDFVSGTKGIPYSEVGDARGDHLLLFRNGYRVKGQLVDVVREGERDVTTAGARVQVIFRAKDGTEQRADIEQVARLYFGSFPESLDQIVGAQKPAEQLPSTAEGAITVPANVPWVDTGIVVRRGERISFQATGEVKLSGNDDDLAVPAGSKKGRFDPQARMPKTLVGALVGRIGESAPFGIGDQTTPLAMPASGRLYLGVNDSYFDDNSGQFVVVTKRQGARR